MTEAIHSLQTNALHVVVVVLLGGMAVIGGLVLWSWVKYRAYLRTEQRKERDEANRW